MGKTAMTHVIKISGYEVDQADSLQTLISALSSIDDQVVLIHGGGSILPRVLNAIGGTNHPAAAEIAAMALRGGINPRLVAALTQHHLQAIGLCGSDLELMYLLPKSDEPIVRFEVLHYLLEQAWLPVLAPLAMESATGAVKLLNADTAAQMIASALAADQLTYIVQTPGVYASGRRISGISGRQCERYIKQGAFDATYTSVVKAASLAAPHVGRVRITDLNGFLDGVETVVVA